jgi:hypothetical protein
MAIRTETLIQELATDLRPVQPLRSPAIRSGAWVALMHLFVAATETVLAWQDGAAAP